VKEMRDTIYSINGNQIQQININWSHGEIVRFLVDTTEKAQLTGDEISDWNFLDFLFTYQKYKNLETIRKDYKEAGKIRE
jgi:hypothetical protein